MICTNILIPILKHLKGLILFPFWFWYLYARSEI